MSYRPWYLAAGACLLVAVAFAGCTAWVARDVPPVLDAAGASQEQAMQLPLVEQFELVGDRYRAFNDLVSGVQKDFIEGEWISAETTNVHMTMRGNAFTGALEGEATETNSYYLTRFWRLDDVGDAETKLDELKDKWDKQGWTTMKSDSDIHPGEFEITATSPEGSHFILDMARSGINLKAYSGIYWGDRKALATAIWNIQQNERNEGTDWRPKKVNSDGYGLIRPGEYPPYPAWNDVAYKERLEKSLLWDERPNLDTSKTH